MRSDQKLLLMWLFVLILSILNKNSNTVIYL